MALTLSSSGTGGVFTLRGGSFGGRFQASVTPPSLLLDLYPSAAAAYSLRKLRTAYSGAAIRVRRSSDNTETDIGFVNNVLDTTTLLTFIGSNSGFISNWYDQSGNAKNATQATMALQPIIVNSGTIINKNTKPSILFASTRLSLSSNFTGTAGTLINLSATTTDPPALNNGQPFGGIGNNVVGGHQPYEDGVIYETFATSIRKTVGNPINNTTTLYLYNAISDSNLYNVKINDTNFYNTTSNIVEYNISFFPLIGSGLSGGPTYYPFIGHISEMIVYTSNQSSNLSGINTNINSFYSIY